MVILDGWGLSSNWAGNSILMSNPPNFTNYWREYPHKVLSTNNAIFQSRIIDSKLKHMEIGAGREILQNNDVVDLSIKNRSFYRNLTLSKSVEYAKKNSKNIHLIGLLSDADANANIEHLLALIEFVYRKNYQNLFIDIIADGLDSPVGKLSQFVSTVQEKIIETGIGKISSISGRDFVMGKNINLQPMLEMLLAGKAPTNESVEDTIKLAYRNNLSDSNIKPTLIRDADGVYPFYSGDVIIFFNLIADKISQFTQAVMQNMTVKDLYVVTLISYSKNIPAQVVFPREELAKTLPEMLARYEKSNLRIAERFKAQHVTTFFNGGREELFAKESRHIFESEKFEDLRRYPKMSALKITKDAIAAISGGQFDFILVNLANADIFAHTGDIALANSAVIASDKCLGEIANANLQKGGITLVTSDHGIVEQIKGRNTRHTKNPVPFIMISKEKKRDLIGGALSTPFSMLSKLIAPKETLADIAPTILELLNIPKPDEMTGHSLLNSLE